MKRLPIPVRFHGIAERMGISDRQYINHHLIRGDVLTLHEKGKVYLTKEEREYLINLLMGRMERMKKKEKE